jgi:NhaB family Na+:H+ antiporter
VNPRRSPAFALFLGDAPEWYKGAVLAFLALNPLVYFGIPAPAGPFVAGWLLVLEFIFTLAMALRCYPLQPGGLLALEAVAIGMTAPEAVYEETVRNLPVVLLLMFMVAGIYFMRDLLLVIFTKLLLAVRSKVRLSLAFCAVAAVLSAFLDALTVIAVIIMAVLGLFRVYVGAASSMAEDGGASEKEPDGDLEEFRAFLRQLVMHAAVGTALGGVLTLVGEPQNVLIGDVMGWDFRQFFLECAPVSLPVLAAGLVTVVAVEISGWFGYGTAIPARAREALVAYDRQESRRRTSSERAALVVQGIVFVVLVVALALHVARVGLIGLMIIVLATAGTGVVDEKRIGRAFEEALPFTALLVVFFAIVAVIHEQHLFAPVMEAVFEQPVEHQPALFFIANGLLSAISDNVFVATVYITSVQDAFASGIIDRQHFEALAIAINTGTNIPSVATPNGQAAFLFLLTSALAPLVGLSYARMIWMALPYTISMTATGLVAVILAL